LRRIGGDETSTRQSRRDPTIKDQVFTITTQAFRQSLLAGYRSRYKARAALIAVAAGAVLAGTLFTGPVAQARDCQDVPAQAAGTAAAGAGAGALIGGPAGAVIGAGVGAIAGMVGGCTTVIKGTPVPAQH
jgi:hypothetical protein